MPAGALGFLTLWPQLQTKPTVATLNALDAQVTSNMAIVPTTNGSISSFPSNPVQLILDLFGYFARNQAPIITSVAPTAAIIGQLYFYDVNATDPDGDDIAYSFSGAPQGFTMDPATGLIQWTPTAAQKGGLDRP